MSLKKAVSLVLACGLLCTFAVIGHAAERSVVAPKNAPEAVGPYSQGITVGDFIYTSGQLPIDPGTNTMPEGIEAQAKQSLNNVKAVVEAAGSNMGKVVKVTIFLKDLNDFAVVNKIYATYFEKDFPARSCVQVARIPKDALIEIEAVAVK